MVLGLIIAGGVGLTALATSIGGSAVLLGRQKTEQARIEQQVKADELKTTLEREENEKERQESLAGLTSQKIAQLTPSKADDFILFLQENALGLSLVIGAVVLLVIVSRNK